MRKTAVQVCVWNQKWFFCFLTAPRVLCPPALKTLPALLLPQRVQITLVSVYRCPSGPTFQGTNHRTHTTSAGRGSNGWGFTATGLARFPQSKTSREHGPQKSDHVMIFTNDVGEARSRALVPVSGCGKGAGVANARTGGVRLGVRTGVRDTPFFLSHEPASSAPRVETFSGAPSHVTAF